jgi:hypothetical protein
MTQHPTEPGLQRDRRRDNFTHPTYYYIRTNKQNTSTHEYLGDVCDLDGVFMSGIYEYRGRRVEESTDTYWRPVVEAYAGSTP